MLFNSYAFLCFFPIVVLLYFALPKITKNYMLLVASYIFYMGWNPVYALLLFGCTLVTFFAALFLGKCKKSLPLVIAAIALVLGTLFYFKYLNFSITFLNKLSTKLGHPAHLRSFDIVLPVGISFFSFQAIGYLLDIYGGGYYQNATSSGTRFLFPFSRN